MTFPEVRRRGFSLRTPVSSSSSLVNGIGQCNDAKINTTPSDLIAELSLCTT